MVGLPEGGATLIDGKPHRFTCNFDDALDDYPEEYRIWPISDCQLDGELAFWRLFVEWRDKFDSGVHPDSLEQHPNYTRLKAGVQEYRHDPPGEARMAVPECTSITTAPSPAACHDTSFGGHSKRRARQRQARPPVIKRQLHPRGHRRRPGRSSSQAMVDRGGGGSRTRRGGRTDVELRTRVLGKRPRVPRRSPRRAAPEPTRPWDRGPRARSRASPPRRLARKSSQCKRRSKLSRLRGPQRPTARRHRGDSTAGRPKRLPDEHRVHVGQRQRFRAPPRAFAPTPGSRRASLPAARRRRPRARDPAAPASAWAPARRRAWWASRSPGRRRASGGA